MLVFTQTKIMLIYNFASTNITKNNDIKYNRTPFLKLLRLAPLLTKSFYQILKYFEFRRYF